VRSREGRHSPSGALLGDRGCSSPGGPLPRAAAVTDTQLGRERSSRGRRSPRNRGIDALRGLLVVLMAIDHANYFVARRHPSGEHWGGPFPDYSTSIGFVTRLITHPVAPGFSFLMGVGMALFAHSRRERGWSERALVRHLVARGTVLIILQFTLVNLAWNSGPEPFPNFYFGVLAALGGGMILGSAFIRLPAVGLAMFGVALLIGMEFTHPDPSQWGLIFDQPLGLVLGYSGGDSSFWSNYPILPWLELVVFGIAFGKWILADEAAAFRWALGIGIGCLVAFYRIRALNGFGNIRPRLGDDWIGYLNLVKYPPAITFTLATMGFNMILLSLLSRLRGSMSRLLDPLVVFGQVPLFLYVTHLYLYSLMGRWFAPAGTSFLGLYLFWCVGLALLYPLCLWYGGAKRRNPDNPVLVML